MNAQLFDEYGLPRQLPKKRLPRTLSGWIKATVEDAQRLSRTRGFKLNMGVFNDLVPDPSKTDPDRQVCQVCMGGAVIVGRGLVPLGEDVGDSQFLAFAIDDIRTGLVEAAAAAMLRHDFIDWLPTVSSMKRASAIIRRAVSYRNDRAPWSAYLKAAEIVKHKPKHRG